MPEVHGSQSQSSPPSPNNTTIRTFYSSHFPKQYNNKKNMNYLLTVRLIHILLLSSVLSRAEDLPGTWEVLLPNADIASMHTAITQLNSVVLLDRTNIGPSNLIFPSNNNTCHLHPCIMDPPSTALPTLPFPPSTNLLRPLSILTDTWCSFVQFVLNDSLLQNSSGLNCLKKICIFAPCDHHNRHVYYDDWTELNSPQLAFSRW